FASFFYIVARCSFISVASCNPRILHSFPTRRSSDLDDPVTRGQMAAFLVRALGLPPSSTDSFVDDDGSVFEKDIQALAASGITRDRKSTRLNSSHVKISYAVFCLKKKTN